VPFALKNLRWLLDHITLPIALPTLLGAFERMIASEKLQHLITPAEAAGKQDVAESVPAPASRAPTWR